MNAIDCYECINCDDADDATQKNCGSEAIADSCLKFTVCKLIIEDWISYKKCFYHTYSFFQIAVAGVESTQRGCYKDIGNAFTDGECKEQSYGGASGTMCVCDSNLCNGVERMLPHFAMFLMTTLLVYYVM